MIFDRNACNVEMPMRETDPREAFYEKTISAVGGRDRVKPVGLPSDVLSGRQWRWKMAGLPLQEIGAGHNAI